MMKQLRDCETLDDFKKTLFMLGKEHYGLRCTCGDGIEDSFIQASGHYQRCDYWKFTYYVNRSVAWAAQHPEAVKKEV